VRGRRGTGRGHFIRYALAAGMCTAVVTLMCGAASAANLFDGMESRADVHNDYRGARAHLFRYVPRYTSGLHGSSAWVMLHDVAYGSYGALAQVGWARAGWWDDGVYYFYEYADAGGHDPGPQIIGAVPNPLDYGTEDLFTVQYVSGGHIEYRINGVTRHTSGYNWTPSQAQWYGEIIVASDQTPGDTNHKVVFEDIKEYSSDTWYRLSPVGRMHNSTTYGTYSNTSSDFRIWDTRYSSEGGL